MILDQKAERLSCYKPKDLMVFPFTGMDECTCLTGRKARGNG